MNADDIRQRKFSDSEKPKKDSKKTEMINIETSGNAKFTADDKYKLIETLEQIQRMKRRKKFCNKMEKCQTLM